MNFKWLTVPFTNRTKEVLVPEAWEVRWVSRYGLYEDSPRLCDATQRCAFFLSEQEAIDFKQALDQAFTLLQYEGGGRQVTLKKTT